MQTLIKSGTFWHDCERCQVSIVQKIVIKWHDLEVLAIIGECDFQFDMRILSPINNQTKIEVANEIQAEVGT